VHVEAEDGEAILSFVPAKAYQSVVLSSPQLKNGVTYTVYSGGSSTGTATDGLYPGGVYTAGIPVTSFTVSGICTTAGSAAAGMPGGNPGQRPGRITR
ncbi:MAG TPA: dockerin type 1, partial [Methanoregula sp.]|nr:dockerin type 1 [Methanoregula sp.]